MNKQEITEDYSYYTAGLQGKIVNMLENLRRKNWSEAEQILFSLESDIQRIYICIEQYKK